MKVRDVPGPEDTNNAEIAAVVAPRPPMIVSDGQTGRSVLPRTTFLIFSRSMSCTMQSRMFTTGICPTNTTIMALPKGASPIDSSRVLWD